jgi:hypothetical protein
MLKYTGRRAAYEMPQRSTFHSKGLMHARVCFAE